MTSARLYSVLLSLYPAELRRDYGEEMMQVFLEDLEHRGPARVWWCSIRELCRIVIPLEVSKREIAVPFIVYVLQAIYLGTIMLLTHRGWGSSGQTILLALTFSLLPAIVAFIALRIGNGSVPVPLNLSRR